MLIIIVLLVGGMAYLDNESDNHMLKAIQDQNQIIEAVVYAAHSRDSDIEAFNIRQMDLIAVIDHLIGDVKANTHGLQEVADRLAALHYIEEQRMAPTEVKTSRTHKQNSR